MQLRNRFLLVGLGVVLFLLITPILVLYARGFKVDWTNRSLVKTGALVIETEPENAQIYLNDEKYDAETPTNIRFLMPDDYIVRIEKEGYQSWTKRLSVRSQLVTWANSNREFIALFVKNPLLKKTWDGTQITLYENRITFLNGTLPTSIDIQNGDEEQISKLPETLPDDTKIEITNLLTTLNIPVPIFTEGQLIRANNQIYLILDETLYLVNDDLEKIYAPVVFAVWQDDSKTLLYANGNEVYLYSANTKTSDLILRSLTAIANPILNDETGYVFFQNESKIKAIELDSRDHRNIFTITDALDSFVVSHDGKKLFTFNQVEINHYTIR